MQNENFMYSGFTSDGKKAWYITMMDNLLMEVEFKDGTVKCLGKVPNTWGEMGAYRTLICKDQKLFLIPFNASLLCIYDLNTKKFDFLDVFQHSSGSGNKHLKLYGRISYENELIIYGLSSVVFRYNIYTNEIKKYYIDKNSVANNEYFFMKDGFVVKDKLILPFVDDTALVEIDLHKDIVEYHVLQMDISEVIHQMVFYENDTLHFILFDKEWKIHVGVVGTKDYLLEDYQVYTPSLDKVEKDNTNNIPFMCGFIKERKIILFPNKQLKVCCIDISEKDCTVHNGLVPSVIEWVREGERCLYNYFDIDCLENGYYYSMQYGQKTLVTIKDDTLQIEEKHLEYIFSEEDAEINRMIMDNSPVLYEKDEYLNLKEYLEKVKER